MADLALQAVYRLFDHMTDGVCLADARGDILYLNEAAERLLQARGAAPQARNVCELLCRRLQTDSGHGLAERCPLLEADGEARSVTFLGRHGPRSAFNWRDDKVQRGELWQDLRVRCLRADLPLAGRQEAVHLVLIEDAAAEMELKRHRADWRSMIAHDLRAPLTSVFAGLKLLEEIHPEAAEWDRQDAKLVHVSLTACRRMMELLDLYLDVARFDAGVVRLSLEDVPLAKAVGEAVQEQSALAASRNVRISVDVPPGLTACADAELLGRVAENLLNNAIKYNVDGGSVTVAAEAAGESVRLSFKDTGRGIEPADLPFIFDRYYQADARRAGRIQGNGLGLTFCKEALDRMGGTIAVRSRPGEGTEFALTLRRAVTSKPQEAESEGVS